MCVRWSRERQTAGERESLTAAVERRTRGQQVSGPSAGRSFLSRVNFRCRLLFRYAFNPRVTAVARKRSSSFCQKCRWQVTAKHTCTLLMCLRIIKWHCKVLHDCMVYTELAPRRQRGPRSQDVGMEMVKGRRLYLTLYCHHQNDFCMKMGSDESRFNVSLIVRGKVTRQCPQITTCEERREPKQGRTDIVLLPG